MAPGAARLQSADTAEADQYKLLLAAREHLESGKSYREIRAGPAFTRKVFAGIEAESSDARPTIAAANLIAILGAVAIVGVLSLVGFWLLKGASPNPADDLGNVYFGKTVSALNFDGPLPAEWRMVGSLPLDPKHGLRPATTAPSDGYDGGGIVTAAGIPADRSFAVEATVHFQHVTDDVIPQIFITDQPDFGTDRATSPHELVWLVSGGRARVVLPDQQIAGSPARVGDDQSLTVRIIVGQQNAQIVSGGKTLWSGTSQLAATPRYVGVRLLRRNIPRRDSVIIQALKVMEK